MLAAGWGMYQAFALPEVREITIALPRLQQPVRLAMLTDLHADRYKQAEFFREMVNRTNALEADAIVITGDFEDGHLYSLAPALAPLRHLKARWGTFAVHGNHDYFSGHQAWQRYLRTLGIRFLNNEHVLPGPGHLVLAGITDPAAARDNCPPPNLEQALSGAPQDKPVVLLAHQPRIAREAASRGVALQLSGHTHGGMAPGLRACRPVQRRAGARPLPQRQYAGLRIQRHRHMVRPAPAPLHPRRKHPHPPRSCQLTVGEARSGKTEFLLNFSVLFP